MKATECDIIDAELPACSVEWLEKRDRLAVGCYELVDGTTSERKGKLEFYSISDENKLIIGNEFWNDFSGQIVFINFELIKKMIVENLD